MLKVALNTIQSFTSGRYVFVYEKVLGGREEKNDHPIYLYLGHLSLKCTHEIYILGLSKQPENWFHKVNCIDFSFSDLKSI